MRILFQGDSVTDSNRNRNDENLGYGYATMVSGELGFHEPNKYEFINRACSGDRSVDVYARIKRDIINLKPDFMSLLIGVNDVWHELASGNGVSPERYERICRMLLDDVKSELPELKIMLLEPFVLDGTATHEKLDEFNLLVRENAKRFRKIAEDYNLPFVTLQDKFDKALELAPADYWLRDGVHPTYAGHRLITEAWIDMFNKEIKNK